MIDLSSVARHLQVRIVEKMDFLDLTKFEMSAKHGSDIARLIKLKPVLAAEPILEKGFWYLSRKTSKGETVMQNSHNRFRKSNLPRLDVTYFTVNEGASLQSLAELLETVDFVKSKSEVLLSFNEEKTDVAFFSKISEALKIATFNSAQKQNPALYSLPQFHELESIRIKADGIEHETLLQLKITKMLLLYNTEQIFPVSTVNGLFQQWYRNKRSIQYLQLYFFWRMLDDPTFMDEVMFSELPFSSLYHFEHDRYRKRCKVAGFNDFGDKKSYKLDAMTNVYCVDRGDKKLVILVCKQVEHHWVKVKECTDLNEIIDIELFKPRVW